MLPQFVKDHYSARFEELEQFATTPSDYCRAVLQIGNPEDLTEGLTTKMKGLMQNAIVMVVAVTASTNTGRQLSEGEWKAVQRACEMCTFLEKAKLDVSRPLPFRKR
jgi:U4/U6 small nuclear ribonucleoprotein PRP31